MAAAAQSSLRYARSADPAEAAFTPEERRGSRR
jgi:hypothetical protein